MCEDCGCGNVERFNVQSLQAAPAQHTHLVNAPAKETGHAHTHTHVLPDGTSVTHSHGHSHEHTHSAASPRQTIELNQSILHKNDLQAARNRGFLEGKGIASLNLVSSPGTGKTALIEKTLELAGGGHGIAVIVGDLQTANDAQRIRDKGAPVIQVTTGTVCHLDAEMVARGLEQLNLDGIRTLLIENVGNLVCPASFDLGEACRVVLLSTTEGEDKPLKYPPIFNGADIVVLTKIDIAEAVGFDREKALENIRSVAPAARIIEVSARTGEGMDAWLAELSAAR